MLHHRRKQLEDLAAREAAGESFWTTEFSRPVRTKVWYALQSALPNHVDAIAVRARQLILHDEGWPHLADSLNGAREDFVEYLLSCEDGMVPTVIESIAHALPAGSAPTTRFAREVAAILREYRISYDLIDGRMVEFSSREMHESVVAPTLRLLGGRADLDGVERAYQDALEEIAKGKPSDAITDAGTALQELLVALGCEGNALGPLIKSARTKKLLAPHDTPLVDAIDKTLNWVSAERSESGDGHKAADVAVADAWLIVHVVGALILRLVEPEKRSG